MSDHWIILVPEDPRYIPHSNDQQRAREYFHNLAPQSDEIVVTLSDDITFFDCGGNFERILCPACWQAIPIDWWQDRMAEDSATGGFALMPCSTPCCGAACALNDLVYEWPQCFGRFAVEAMNPSIGELSDLHLAELERILNTRMRVVYRHL